jgi:lipoate-protein ligase B
VPDAAAVAAAAPSGSETSGTSGAADGAIAVEWLGLQRYADALALQRQAVADRIAGRRGDRLLLVEHPPVVTLGRSTQPAHLKVGPAELQARGIELFEVARGGDVTYHAPGQLVGYPILDLDASGRRDVHAHLRNLELGLIEALEELGLPACRQPGWTGVFVDCGGPASPHPLGSTSASASAARRNRKIASIGVGLRRWVTFHGFALNVSIDLSGFELIVPCGLAEVEMTSVCAELARRSEAVASERAAEAAGSGGIDARVREIVARRLAARLVG